MTDHNFIYNGKELFAFGCSLSGQLGLSDCQNMDKPTLVRRDKEIPQ